jgi:phosphohistidine phosphatase
MYVYLVQHGKAKSAVEDPERRLSEAGREEITQVSIFLAAQRIAISLIQHSGTAGAEETAHILAATMRCTSGPCRTEGLDPSDDPSGTANFLKVYTDDILIVGHLPHLERLTSLLLTGSPDRRPVRFSTGGVICLEKERGGPWSVVWAVVPELLSKPTRRAA